MEQNDVLRTIAPGVVEIQGAPRSPSDRTELAARIGRKAAGLAMLPSSWTPPFVIIEAYVYEEWRNARVSEAHYIITQAAEAAAQQARKWPNEWSRGVTIRSSATEETLSERGSNESVPLTADFDGSMITRAALQVYKSFSESPSTGAMAIMVQARVAHLALGHISNEQRVSKTINQWMWEYEPDNRAGGRFNSQRDSPPNPRSPFRLSGVKPSHLTRAFRQIGRWCTELQAGRTHLEWGATTDTLWLFQLDFENDQPDKGVTPTAFLRSGDFRPPGELPEGSPFQLAPTAGGTGWQKIDKIPEFLSSGGEVYPTLIYITGDAFISAVAGGRDLRADLDTFAHGRVVCRTDCRSDSLSLLNLPRTQTVDSEGALNFIAATITSLEERGVPHSNVCFILHKFIPSVAAAWAVARKGDQVVRVDSLWGLPDGLQYLPHDTFEYDVRRRQQVAERQPYKHSFLQETSTGAWEVVRVARNASRRRSLPAPDLAYVAQRTQEVAKRIGRNIQIMWFCLVPEETGLSRNIPWFSMSPADRPFRDKSAAPMKRPFSIRSLDDLDLASELPNGQFILRLEPDDPELFRSQEFLERVVTIATKMNFPVSLTGSILGHAFYVLEKAGVSVTALSEPTRSRTRQRKLFGKLVRDAIPTKITEGGETVTLAEIAKGEARAALVGKLLEESYELLAADTPPEVTAELADLLEVVRSLAHATGIDWADVQMAAEEKRNARGGFEKSVVLLETSWPGWSASTRPASSFTIPLSRLAQITEDGKARTVPFPLLLAHGFHPVVRMADGTEIAVDMSGAGVRLSPADEVTSSAEQLDLDF